MTRRRIKHWLIGAAATMGIAAVGGSLFVYSGVYNVSALQQHTLPVYRLLQFAMERSVAVRSHETPPNFEQLDWQVAGLLHYENHCRRCHGAPGVAPDDFALGMVPAPTAIAELARKRNPQAIYWVVENGIKMSGMPAWQYRLTQDQMWELVAFVTHLPTLTSADYAHMLRVARQQEQSLAQPVITEDLNPNALAIARGRTALQQYNCVSCHQIPGVTAARNHVGPPLGGITQRSFIAGVLEYSDDNFVQWVRFPRQVDPNTTMPNLGVSEVHAREMLAYLKSVGK